MSVHNTQPPTPLTIGDIPEKSRLLVTGNGLRSNRDELLGDNGMQQAPSTPKRDGPKAVLLGTKSEEPRAEAPRTQYKETQTEPPRTQTREARVKPPKTQNKEPGAGAPRTWSAKMTAKRCLQGRNKK